MFLVRTGEDSICFNEFKEKNIVAIGWNEIGDLSKMNHEQIKKKFIEVYPDKKPGQQRMISSIFNLFCNEMRVGDKVIVYDSERETYLIGKVLGSYAYDRSVCFFNHYRKVEWLHEIARCDLSANTVGALTTISSVSKISVSAEKEISTFLGAKQKLRQGALDLGVNSSKGDIVQEAVEFISDKLWKLHWEDMELLIAGILRAQGYKTMMTPRGPDGGIDIKASPDGLCLEDPRIFVQVKHKENAVGADDIKKFIGILRQGFRGLYVSTGGFTKEAKKEAERAGNPITLIDTIGLVKLIFQNHDQFDDETRTLLPLMKIYWPV